tara:strand:+ start:21300 stop:22406 length:1107 start_codon:yes stop_codon:yes gene_type:complete
MASTFKTFVSDDIANTRTLLHESIPITGSIVNGITYATNNNIKSYGHGMFQSVYDYPYTSSSANHIFDMAIGIHPDDAGATTANPQFAKRSNIYNQMAQVLVGHDVNGEIRKFDKDGDLTGGDKYGKIMFFNFARLLGKDEIKKGTFSMTLGVTLDYFANITSMHGVQVNINDSGAATDYRVNSPAGEYGVLKLSEVDADSGSPEDVLTNEGEVCGLIYYQAGIVAIDPYVFNTQYMTNTPDNSCEMNAAGNGMLTLLTVSTTATNDEILEGIRKRIVNIQFSNTTELNSTIYFCRVGHNDFNYSSNPTYLENSKIRVKDKSTDSPVSYITTVGLYSADNEMLAVAKLSEPLRKDPTNDMTLRVRLDY